MVGRPKWHKGEPEKGLPRSWRTKRFLSQGEAGRPSRRRCWWAGRRGRDAGRLSSWLSALGTLPLSLSYLPSRQTVLALTPGLRQRRRGLVAFLFYLLQERILLTLVPQSGDRGPLGTPEFYHQLVWSLLPGTSPLCGSISLLSKETVEQWPWTLRGQILTWCWLVAVWGVAPREWANFPSLLPTVLRKYR